MEAGKQKGIIKKSRTVFSDLIEKIQKAFEEQSKLANKSEEKFEKAKEDIAYYKKTLEESRKRSFTFK